MKRAACLALVAWCGCHRSPPATTASAWDLVLAQIRPDGTVSVDTARQAFSLVFKPLPGVPTPPGAGSTISDATPAVRWILAHESELTSAQHDVVERFFATPAGLPADAATQARYAKLVDDASTTIAARLMQPKLMIESIVWAEDVKVGDNAALGWATARDASFKHTGPYAGCLVSFNALLERTGARAIAETVPHEVFHCYEARMSPNLGAFVEVADWLIEGGAEWAGGDIAGHLDYPVSKETGLPGSSWTKCLTMPYRSLYGLSYDGLCFFGAMSAATRSPWSYFDGMFTAFSLTGNQGAFLAGAGDESFFHGWAPSFLRSPEFGPQWDASGPGITRDHVTPNPVALGNGGLGNDLLEPVSNNIYRLDVKAEILLLRTPPWSTLHSTAVAGFHTDAPAGDWCTRSGSCDCPMGSARAGEHVPSLPADYYFLAVGGGLKGTQWLAAGETLDDYCNSDRVETCVQGSWVMQSAGPLAALDTCKVNEPIGTVVSFAKDGSSGEDFSQTSAVSCTTMTGDVYTVNLGGHDRATVTADHGQMVVANVDSSAVTVTTSLNGMDLGAGLSSLFQAKLAGGTSLGYSCKGTTMTLTNASGTTYTLLRL